MIMLFHHLFYRMEFIDMYWWHFQISGHPIIQILAYHMKICVAIFVFLSAYGLTFSYTKSNPKNTKYILKYIFNKIIKLYELYWPCVAVCIAIGWITKTRIPTEIYSSIGQFIRDLFGIAYITDGVTPYVGAWWYISLTILIYIVFPILYKIMKKYPIPILIISFCLGIVNFTDIPIFIEIQRYTFIVMLGIYFANNNIFNKLFEWSFKKRILVFTSLSLLLLLLIRFVKSFTFDGFLVVSIIMLLLTLIDRMPITNKIFKYIGIHSGNIFLIHGIIYRYSFIDFIYSFKYPILIFAVLLIISLVISIILELLKKVIVKTKYKEKNA